MVKKVSKNQSEMVREELWDDLEMEIQAHLEDITKTRHVGCGNYEDPLLTKAQALRVAKHLITALSDAFDGIEGL
jgi:hypothetical protein